MKRTQPKRKPMSRCDIWHLNLARKVEQSKDEWLAFQCCPHCGERPPGPTYFKPEPKPTIKHGEEPMTPAERKAKQRALEKAEAILLAKREARWRADLPSIIRDAERMGTPS